MKKLLIILVCLLALCGCKKADTADTKISDETKVLFKVAGNEYKNKDLYYDLINMVGTDFVLDDLKVKVAQKENIDFTELEKDAEEYYQNINDAFGEDYVTMYGGKDAIVESYIAAMINDELAKVYVKANLEKHIENYAPCKAQYAVYDTKEDAQNLIDKVHNGSTFDMAAAEAGYNGDASTKVITKRETTLNAKVQEYCTSNPSLGLSDIIEYETETKDADGNTTKNVKYYVVNVNENDVNNFINDFIDHLLANSYIDNRVCLNSLLENYEVNVYDQELYDKLIVSYSSIGHK